MTSAEETALRPFSKGFDWGKVFNRYRAKGEDHGSCAQRADEAQRRYARKNGYRSKP